MPKTKTARAKTKTPSKTKASSKAKTSSKTQSGKTKTVPPVTKIAKAQEQHMLLLFVPLNSKTDSILFNPPTGKPPAGVAALQKLLTGNGPDIRPATGVHFFMIHLMRATDTSPIKVPTFQPAPTGPDGVPKDLLVVLSIYDSDFVPYISAFFQDAAVVAGLNGLLTVMDESGIIDNSDHTSAYYISSHGGVKNNPEAFIKLLMRYNFADPTIPAVGPGGMQNPPKAPRYFLGATFPGLTVGMLLRPGTGYPNALDLWPAPDEAPKISFEPSTPPK